MVDVQRSSSSSKGQRTRSNPPLPLVDVGPRRHHAVIDLGDLMGVIIGVQSQQFVGQSRGLRHLLLPQFQVLHEDLQTPMADI